MVLELSYEPSGVCCIYVGNSGVEDFLTAIKQYVNHPKYSEFRYALHDFSRIESFQYDDKALVDLLELIDVQNVVSLNALPVIVAVNEELRRTVEIFCELSQRPVEMFDSVPAAFDWVSKRLMPVFE